jgi:anion-transporting  ArsA/GET3 family ATPase
MEVEGRQVIAQLFDSSPLPYEERRVARAPDGGEVRALAVDPEAALLEYLEMFYNLRRAGSALSRIGAIDFATTIAPGVRDVLLTGKAVEAVKRTERGRPVFDAVVMDAPPTGRITRFLNVNSEVAGIARMGPIHSQAKSVMAVMGSPLTAVHLVTLLEEMPVQETLDGITELRQAGLPVGSVFINMQHPEELPEEALTATEPVAPAEIHSGLLTAGVTPPTPELVGALAREAADHAVRVRLQRRERERLEAIDVPRIDLPLLDGVDLGGVYELAESIVQQGPR